MKNKNFHFWMHAYKKKIYFRMHACQKKKFYSSKSNK